MRRSIEQWTRELKQAGRSLLRAPGFAVVTVVTLALAIGSNTAIFSVVEGVLLDPLPYPDSDRLVALRASFPGSDMPEEVGLGGEFFVQYQENATTLEDIALIQVAQTTVAADTNVERLFISAVSPSLFSTLGVEPVLGRLPTLDDPEGEVAVLSYWLWNDWYGQDPSVLNRSVEVSGNVLTIIGVMGPGFSFPQERVSLWLNDVVTEPVQPGGFGLNVIARMAPGATQETVAAELATLAQRLPERFGGTAQYARTIAQHRPIVRSLEEQLVGDVATPLWILMGTVAIVLLIACANVANLLIARAESRRLDLAVRRALGSGRGGLIRAQMAEALVLAAAGALGGVILAWVGVPLLVRAAPEGVPGISGVGLDPTALLFTGGIAVLAACVCGLLPAWRFSGVSVLGSLRDSHRVGSGPSHRTRDTLVVAQTAAALVLLVASGLLLQSFVRLSRVDPGYDTRNIFTFQMAPDGGAHGLVDGPTWAQFHYDFMDRLAALPGVESVGVVNTLPLDEGAGTGRIVTDRSDLTGEEPLVRVTFAGGDYFRTMGIQLLSGEDFERNADLTADPKAIISQAAAERLWPDEDPLGHRFRPAGADSTAWISVGGVVEDVMLSDFREEAPEPLLYLPMVGQTARSWAVGTPAYVVRTARAETVAPEIRELIRQVAPDAPMYRIFTMAGLAARSMASLSFTMLTLALAAGLALVIGAVGIYGVLAYVVSQRTREIGIRMAIGAQAGQVRRIVVLQGSRLAVIGVVIGLVAAFFATRVLDSLLFGVTAIDAPTFVAMASVMVGVALLAAYGPARRASSVDPIVALRAE